jgi:hypothetical protein
MLEKLTTHDIQDVSALFSLADKCARATEGRSWHSPAASVVKVESKSNAGTQAEGSGNNNKKKMKKASGNRSLGRAPTIAVATAAAGGGPRGNKCPRQPSNSDDGSTKCPMHKSTRHSTSECREMKKLAE